MTDTTQELPPIKDRPLVTFMLFAYNQEKYIREALEGAFAQTYEPLEILLSDDCSTDSTFEIMKKMVSFYDGPHTVRLNRNEKNMGISAHVRFLHEMSSGEYIIHAAGDDISYSNRTEVIVSGFLKEKIEPSIVKSNAVRIDSEGAVLGEFIPKYIKSVRVKNYLPFNIECPGPGSTYAISRKLLEKFPPPNKRLIAEDNMLCIRANLLDGALYLPDVLVKYRVNAGGVSSGGNKLRSLKETLDNEVLWSNERIYGVKQGLDDIKFVDEECYKKSLPVASKYINHKTNLIKIIESSFLKSTFFFAFEIFRSKITGNFYTLQSYYKYGMFKIYIIKWFPMLLKARSVIFEKFR